MAQYRYLAADLKSGTIREEIPFSTVSFSHVLNRPGSWKGTIGLRHAKAARSILDPGKTAIHVERNGAIAWSGILWAGRANAKSAELELTGEGWWSYFRRRLITATKTYAATDQLAIVRDLVTWAQAQAGGNIGLIVGTETSGVLRDRVYQDFELKNLGEAVEQLAAVSNGFDFAVESAWAGQVVANTLRLFYPRRGAVTPFVFELGTNLEELSTEVDATRQATAIYAVGAGEAAAMLRATSSDATLLVEFPLLEETVAYKDVTVLSTLQAHADLARINTARPVERVPMLVAHQANPDTAFGNYVTGDTVRVRAAAGWMAMDRLMRVQELRVDVGADGKEAVGLAFVPEEATL